MDNEFLATPRDSPSLDFPRSSATVDLRLIDTNLKSEFSGPTSMFLQPPTPGFTTFNFPVFTFLVSHKSGRHVLFDNGIRRDVENIPPRMREPVMSMMRIDSMDDPASILDSHAMEFGLASADVEAVIWSHTHFDHTGDMKRFPPTTDLVVGPGVKADAWPGYPTNPDAITSDSDAEGRNVREIDFMAPKSTGEPLMVAGFRAHDYFGDGSFYLLDAPGHAVGHMCALARVTPSPQTADGGEPDSTFVFLGADACHHAGAIRPNDYFPLPRSINPSPFLSDRMAGACCPGAGIQSLLTHGRPDQPVFTLVEGVCPDLVSGRATLRRIQELEADGRTLVMLAHDASMLEHVDVFPKTLNDWYSRSTGKSSRWTFFGECEDEVAEWKAKQST